MTVAPFDVLAALRDSGGGRVGHTVFRNGLHGDGWLEKGAVVRRPDLLGAVARIQAGRFARTSRRLIC